MMVDLNENELASLAELFNTHRRERGDKSVEGEVLELKLVEALLKETGHLPHVYTEKQEQEAMRLLEEHTRQEESLNRSASEDRQPGQQ
jgi:hypothetical protein